MADTYAGMFGSGNWSTPNERPKNWLEKAFELWPDAPGRFLMMMQKWRKRTVDDYEFNMFESPEPDQAFTVNGSHNSSVTAIAIDAPGSTPAKGIVAGDRLIVPSTGEILLVASDPVSPYTSITVVRGFGATSGATIPDNAVLRWIGTLAAEGTRTPKARVKGVDTITNYTEIVKNTAEVSKSSEKIRSRPFKSFAHAKAFAFRMHRIGICQSLYHGTKDLGTDAAGKRRTATGGLDNWVTTNLWDASTGASLDDFEDRAAQVFEYGSDHKVLVGGMSLLTVLHRAVMRNSLATWNLGPVAPKNLTYGMTIRRLESPFGILDIVHDPLLTLDATYRSYGYVVDPAYVEFITLNGFDTNFHDNEQLPDESVHKGHWETEFGLGIVNEKAHAIWKNVTTWVP